MEDLKSILVDLQTKLHALVERIPLPKSTSVNNDGIIISSSATKPDLINGGPGCGEQYHTPVLAAFHKWARILLSLFVDKVGSLQRFTPLRLLLINIDSRVTDRAY